MSEPTLKLPQAAEELLRDFPMSEPDFEAQAKAIEARLKGDAKVSDPGALLPPSAGISDDDLLKAPPLAAEAGEPGTTAAAPAASSVRVAEPPKSNFAEMARKSLQKKDDDAAQLAKELLAATAQSRRPDAQMVERVRAAGRASATASPLPTGEVASGDEPQRARVLSRLAPVSVQSAPSNRGTLIGIAGGVLALAAAVALFLKTEVNEPSTTDAALAAEKASLATPAASAAPAAPAPVKPGEVVVSPDALAAAPHNEASPAAPKAGAAKLVAGAPAAAAAKAPAPSAAAKQEAVVLQEDPEPVPVAAEPKPEAAPEPPLRPAEGNTGGVPLTPSAGAVSSALSGVRGAAQQCLAGQSAPVTASITFAADGHVLRVGASGPAAACIQGALSKARIQPFAKESFTANTTIRPP